MLNLVNNHQGFRSYKWRYTVLRLLFPFPVQIIYFSKISYFSYIAMPRIPQPEHIILQLNLEIVLYIFSILLESDFKDFCHLFQIWFPYQGRKTVHHVLQNLDWTGMHKHDSPWLEEDYNRFSMFVSECRDRGIKHALCYVSCKNVLIGTCYGQISTRRMIA